MKAREQSVELILGNNAQILPQLQSNSFHAMLTDPPGGISFYGQEWDSDKGGRDQWIAWLRSVMVECLRILKPGAYGLVWAFPRTVHWTMLALEDAGFEIVRPFTHHHANSIVKAQNMGKAIDKKLNAMPESERYHINYKAHSPEGQRWNDYFADVKPTTDFWILVKKPIEGTQIDNVLKWGTGALNIGACRLTIPTGGRELGRTHEGPIFNPSGINRVGGGRVTPRFLLPEGRFPSDAIFEHSPECTDTKCAPNCVVSQLNQQGIELGLHGGGQSRAHVADKHGVVFRCTSLQFSYGDGGDEVSRFYYCPQSPNYEKYMYLSTMDEVVPFEKGIELLKHKDYYRRDSENPKEGYMGHTQQALNQQDQVIFHPTPKSMRLLRYFIKLIAPANGRIIDPFAGTATTLRAAYLERRRAVGIEMEYPYFRIGEYALEQEKQQTESQTTFAEMRK